jgi:hypothetical protein
VVGGLADNSSLQKQGGKEKKTKKAKGDELTENRQKPRHPPHLVHGGCQHLAIN